MCLTDVEQMFATDILDYEYQKQKNNVSEQ
jgi:hypothetical protein